jgi:Na+/melibiose symporter-like transporter
MNEPPARRRNPVTANPAVSAAIAILLIANIFFVLYSPLYSSVTPKVGSWPFFYFYLLVSMPVTSLLLWAVIVLQKRLARTAEGEAVR